MKFAKGSPAAKAVREKARNYQRHWTHARSVGEHGLSFAIPMSRKSVKRIRRAEKMAATYKAFFADPDYQDAFRLGDLWTLISVDPRLVRDTVLGSANDRGGK